MTSATFRHPGPLAISVAGVDQMSGGRVEFGIGAGWYVDEHTAYGIPFLPIKDRFDVLEEQLAVITGLWSADKGSPFSFAGKHYTVSDSPALPKPVQPHIPVIIGGGGKKRTPELTARYADEYNLAFEGVETGKALIARARGACDAIGRDPNTLGISAALVVCVGSDEAEVTRRAAAIGREPAELRENGVAGTPEEVIDKLQTYAEIGVSRVYLQVLDLSDLEHLQLIAEQVSSRV